MMAGITCGDILETSIKSLARMCPSNAEAAWHSIVSGRLRVGQVQPPPQKRKPMSLNMVGEHYSLFSLD